MIPVWKGSVAFEESALPVADENGKAKEIRLLHPAREIFEVTSATKEQRYEEGKDYILRDGNLIITEGSAIAVMPQAEYYPEKPIENGSFPRVGGGNVRFDDVSFFHEHQILVTYRHAEAWQGDIPKSKLEYLPKTAKLLENGQPIKIVFYGDSISVGCNSSSFGKVPPFAPDWCEMTAMTIESARGCEVTRVRTAVGGKTSKWGRENAYERSAKYKPDLLVLAFGMNDGFRTPEEFIDNLNSIIECTRRENPKCETVIVSTMLPNSEAQGFFCNQKVYESHLLELEKEGLAVCDITNVHETLLTRKAYGDMTGNNINHPNDYLSRVYAQVLLKTLGIECGF